MALINCAECGKEISDKAPSCLGCGCPVSNNNPNRGKDLNRTNYKVRIVLNRITLIMGVFFLILILLSEGGLQGNTRMFGVVWFALVAGVLGLMGKKNNKISIASVVLYFIGAFYNIMMSFILPSHIIIFLIFLGFGTTLLVNVVNSDFTT